MFGYIQARTPMEDSKSTYYNTNENHNIAPFCSSTKCRACPSTETIELDGNVKGRIREMKKVNGRYK